MLIHRLLIFTLLSFVSCSNDVFPGPQNCDDLASYLLNKNRTTTLMWACELGCTKYVKAHIDGVNVNEENVYGMTPIYYAIAGGGSLVPLLVEKGADINHRERLASTTVLGAAIDASNMEVVDYLLQHGVSPNISSDNQAGYYPIHMAVLYNQPEILSLLIRYGAKLDVVNKHGKTALHLAQRANKENLIRMLKKEQKRG